MIARLPVIDRAGWTFAAVITALYGLSRVLLGVSYVVHPVTDQYTGRGEPVPTGLIKLSQTIPLQWLGGAWVIAGLLMVASAAVLFIPKLYQIAVAAIEVMNVIWVGAYSYGWIFGGSGQDSKGASSYLGSTALVLLLAWFVTRFRPPGLMWHHRKVVAPWGI